MPRKKTQFEDSLNANMASYHGIYYDFVNMALGCFEWKNMPTSVRIGYMETKLARAGKVVFFKDEAMGFLCLPLVPLGNLDVYGNIAKRQAVAINGYTSPELDDSNSVIIYNNRVHLGILDRLEIYARRIYEIDRTIDVNVKAQKTPIMIESTEEQRLSVLQLYQKYDGNQPFIFGKKGLLPESLRVLKTDAPYLADKLYSLREKYYNEALQLIGIPNLNEFKKERTITSEASQAQGGTVANRLSRLSERQDAVQRIVELWPELEGLSVDFNSGFVAEGRGEVDEDE